MLWWENDSKFLSFKTTMDKEIPTTTKQNLFLGWKNIGYFLWKSLRTSTKPAIHKTRNLLYIQRSIDIHILPLMLVEVNQFPNIQTQLSREECKMAESFSWGTKTPKRGKMGKMQDVWSLHNDCVVWLRHTLIRYETLMINGWRSHLKMLLVFAFDI